MRNHTFRLMFLILLFTSIHAYANWNNIPGYHSYHPGGPLTFCQNDWYVPAGEGLTIFADGLAGNDTVLTVGSPGTCFMPATNIVPNNYVPRTGMYAIKAYVCTLTDSCLNSSQYVISGFTNIRSDISVRDQTLTFGNANEITIPPNGVKMTGCYMLIDESGNEYTLQGSPELLGFCTGGTPLPPDPPVDTSCTINNGNTLDVNLGTIERAKLPTVAGSGEDKSVPVEVVCTGEDLTVNMQLDYIAITLGASEIVKSDAEGLGVAISYNDKVLSTTDITPVTLQKGVNTLNLSFQAVRDPNVAEGDVPVGQFKASATLVMTQQ
ncbi:fimbrial protein [Citrobacter telavivensis]